MRIYLSGKITGLTKEQYTTKFALAAEVVEANGHEPVNPIEVDLSMCTGVESCGGEGEIHHWRCYMKHDLIDLIKSDAIAVLPNWTDSKGAQLETSLADSLTMPMFAISNDYTRLYEWRNHD